jgi:hypothetical protein
LGSKDTGHRRSRLDHRQSVNLAGDSSTEVGHVESRVDLAGDAGLLVTADGLVGTLRELHGKNGSQESICLHLRVRPLLADSVVECLDTDVELVAVSSSDSTRSLGLTGVVCTTRCHDVDGAVPSEPEMAERSREIRPPIDEKLHDAGV